MRSPRRSTPRWLVLVLLAACGSSSNGGDDDDDVTIHTGDGDADTDADADCETVGNVDLGTADPSCGGACVVASDLCEGVTEEGCVEGCGTFGRLSDATCLDAFRDYNDCLACATECDENGVASCTAAAQARDQACSNGCLDVIDCIGDCADGDQECGNACVQNGDPGGVVALDALITCWGAACGDPPAADAPEDEQTAWENCLSQSCIDEQSSCR